MKSPRNDLGWWRAPFGWTSAAVLISAEIALLLWAPWQSSLKRVATSQLEIKVPPGAARTVEPPVGTTNQAELTVQSAPPAAKTVEPPVRATNQPAPTVQAAPPAAESAVVAAPVTVPEAQTQQFGSLTSQSIARQPDPVRAGDGVKPGLLETNQVQNVVSGESRVLEREQRATVHDTLPATNAATAMMAQAPATNTKPAVVSATNAPPAVALKPLDWRLVPAVYHTSMLCIMLEVYYRFAWRA